MMSLLNQDLSLSELQHLQRVLDVYWFVIHRVPVTAADVALVLVRQYFIDIRAILLDHADFKAANSQSHKRLFCLILRDIFHGLLGCPLLLLSCL